MMGRDMMLLPESSNSDLVRVCRGRFGQHMPIPLCFQTVEKPAYSVWSNICGTSYNTALLCCQGPRGTCYFRQNTAWGAPVWRIILNHSHCCCVLPSSASLYPGQYRYKYRNICTGFCMQKDYYLALQLLLYVAEALQIAALCNWTNVKGLKHRTSNIFQTDFQGSHNF